MEEVAGRFDHDVVVVAVTHAEDVRRHAISGARRRKIVNSSFVFQRRRIVFGQPVGNRPVFKRARQSVFDLECPSDIKERLENESTHLLPKSKNSTRNKKRLKKKEKSIAHLNLSQGFSTVDEFDKSSSRSSWDAAKGHHFQIESVLPPKFVHNSNLYGQRIRIAVCFKQSRFVFDFQCLPFEELAYPGVNHRPLYTWR